MAFRYMQAIAERYKALGYTPYRWFRAEEPPAWKPLAKPLSSARIGLLSTAGAYVVGQMAYHYKDDSSIRCIPVATRDEDVRFSHLTENYLVDARRTASGKIQLPPSPLTGGVSRRTRRLT